MGRIENHRKEGPTFWILSQIPEPGGSVLLTNVAINPEKIVSIYPKGTQHGGEAVTTIETATGSVDVAAAFWDILNKYNDGRYWPS